MFMFDLELPGLTEARAEAVAQECADRNAWPIEFVPGREEKRWYGVRKSFPDVIEIPTESGKPALSDDAERDAEALAMRPEAAARIATTLEIIGDHFPDGFVFRATYSGSPVQYDEDVSVEDLAARVRGCALNEFTRYTVPPRSEVGGA